MGITDRITDKAADKLADLLEQVRQDTATMAAGLTEYANGQRLRGARPIDISRHPKLAGPGAGRVVGWSSFASGGPVTAVLRDSTVPGDGDVLAAFALADGEDAGQWFGPGGISYGFGVYLEQTNAGDPGAGSLVGALYLGAVD